jgi:hypothetical protein
VPNHVPDVIHGLRLWTLHTDVLVLNASLQSTLLAGSGDKCNRRGIDVVVEPFWNLKLDPIICPWMNIIVSIKGRVRIKSCPFTIWGCVSGGTKTLILEPS